MTAGNPQSAFDAALPDILTPQHLGQRLSELPGPVTSGALAAQRGRSLMIWKIEPKDELACGGNVIEVS